MVWKKTNDFLVTLNAVNGGKEAKMSRKMFVLQNVSVCVDKAWNTESEAAVTLTANTVQQETQVVKSEGQKGETENSQMKPQIKTWEV